MIVFRHDTGQEHEVPDGAIRWGPETGQGTCRAQLLRALPATIDVPYILPFPGAKWAVRVTPVSFLIVPATTDDRRKLGELLEAAGAALGSEADAERPDTLGEALDLLARVLECTLLRPMSPGVSVAEPILLKADILRFLERETTAEIRGAYQGPESAVSDRDIRVLRFATGILRSGSPDDMKCADDLCDLADRLAAWRRGWLGQELPKAAARG
jgi:hypothetical protein